MVLSKELLTHVQWYFTKEAQRFEGWSYEPDIRYYNTCLQYLEEVRIALKEHESNADIP
jgi:hypothetical protein